MFEFSKDQKSAIDKILEWYTDEKMKNIFISLGGYAGTGKTTLIAKLRRELKKINGGLKVGFASYTGKATRVMRKKLSECFVLEKGDFIGTIHSLIYSPIVNDREEIVGWKRKDKIEYSLLIIDEASMVDLPIWNHLLSYGVPIIVVGDHGQLPPINGNFNLMQDPQLKLTQIHRQARENPIIGLSIQAREHGMVRGGEYSKKVKKITTDDMDYHNLMTETLSNYTYDTLILCGYNRTRQKLNQHIRSILGFESSTPQKGDRVICLRNNHKKQIFNGMLGTIESIESTESSWYMAEIAMDGETNLYRGLISASQFETATPHNFGAERRKFMEGDLFDFGYAMTVHKAQGSQAKKVILFEERFSKMSDDEWKRWLYTAVTRAQEELYIFGK